MSRHLGYAFFLFFTLLKTTISDKQYTVVLTPNDRQCFFEVFKKAKDDKGQITLEYQVLDGGDLQIDTTLHTPDGNLIFADYRKAENTHSFTPHEDGDYQICFDNGISSYYGKTIFFAFDEQGDDGNDEDDGEDEEDDDDNYWKRLVSDDFKQINEYDGKVNDFKYRVERIHSNIETMGKLQTTLKSIESRDRHLGERNYERVNFWSAANLAVMLTVLIFQAFAIRALFNEKSILNSVLDKLGLFND